MLSPEYLAGLIDGEGHVGFNVNRNHDKEYLRVCLEINMTYQPIIALLHEELGGHYGQHTENRINRKAQYRWRVVNKQAMTIIKMVMPYLIVKKPQAILATTFDMLGFANIPEVNAKFKEAMHKLNKKGSGIVESDLEDN